MSTAPGRVTCPSWCTAHEYLGPDDDPGPGFHITQLGEWVEVIEQDWQCDGGRFFGLAAGPLQDYTEVLAFEPDELRAFAAELMAAADLIERVRAS